jgi:hypothetical protein
MPVGLAQMRRAAALLQSCGWRGYANCIPNGAEGVPARHATSRVEHFGDCHASFCKGITGFGAHFMHVRRRVRTRWGRRGRRWRRDCWRQRSWTRGNRHGNAERRGYHRLDVRRVGFEHDGQPLRYVAEADADAEERGNGCACLRQRNDEALLITECRELKTRGRPRCHERPELHPQKSYAAAARGISSVEHESSVFGENTAVSRIEGPSWTPSHLYQLWPALLYSSPRCSSSFTTGASGVGSRI